jgi:hypothetical protein
MNGTLYTQLNSTLARLKALPKRFWMWYMASQNAFLFTIAMFMLIFCIAVAVDQVRANRALDLAVANPRSFQSFMGMVSQRAAITGEVVSWGEYGEPALIKFGSPAGPYVYDVWYLRWFGTATQGDKITFFWKQGTSNCPTVYPEGDWYLIACGLTPLAPEE